MCKASLKERVLKLNLSPKILYSKFIPGSRALLAIHVSVCLHPTKPVPGSQIVWWGSINMSRAKIRRAQLGKRGGGGRKNGGESLFAFL